MTQDDLGPMPEPQTESPELVPGGVDAIGEDGGTPLVPDIDPQLNPDAEEIPDPLQEGEDTSTEATEDASENDEPEQESPA